MTTVVTTGSETPLAEVRNEIARACAAARRDPSEVTLVAISKMFGADAIAPVIAAGQRVFGENRVQEAKAKWPALTARPSGHRTASGRAAAVEQGEGRGGAVRCHPFRRPAQPGGGAGQGMRQAGAPADAVRRGQYRRRAAEGGRLAGRHRRIRQDLPGELRARYRRADVHSPGRRAPGAALRSHREDRAPQRAQAYCPWA